MRLYLKTWRYGQEAINSYHGSGFDYDPQTATLTVYKPVTAFDPQNYDPDTGDNGGPVEAVATIVTLTNTDEYTVYMCQETCTFHPSE